MENLDQNKGKWERISIEDCEINLNTGVALTPGSGFGIGGSNWLRLALVRPSDELQEAVSNIAPWWHANS